MGDLLAVIETGSRPKGGAQSSGIPSIGAEKIESFGLYDFSAEKYISVEYFDKLKRGKVKSGDVLLYKDGAYTGKSSMSLDGFPHSICAVNEHVFILRTKNLYAQSFLYYTLQNDAIHQKIYSLACGKAAQPGLNQQELCSIEIPFPSKKDIVSFEESVNPFMHKIASLALEARKLAELRNALLPKLLSGELDVSDIDL
ncbi:restriction endonuclease subunit S [Bullifex porci]|uniref:restriction endonuclease subunit S n=1 Tax=Bullifex porci TaxID=2606638 RepID=UPI0023F00B25|nr:restriction endonuclease subunit S [Bullifex porci]MDD7254419.1 restriction endonuclease subunit S [Bullifex porci]